MAKRGARREGRVGKRSRIVSKDGSRIDNGPAARRELARAIETLDLTANAADEAAFHLLDWADELIDFAAFLRRPGGRPAEDVLDLVMRMVTHAPHHLNAAHRIVMGLPVTDVFGLGAVKGPGRAARKGGEAYPPPKTRAARKPRKTRK